MSSKKDIAKVMKAEADKKRNNRKTNKEKALEARRRAINDDEKRGGNLPVILNIMWKRRYLRKIWPMIVMS